MLNSDSLGQALLASDSLVPSCAASLTSSRLIFLFHKVGTTLYLIGSLKLPKGMLHVKSWPMLNTPQTFVVTIIINHRPSLPRIGQLAEKTTNLRSNTMKPGHCWVRGSTYNCHVLWKHRVGASILVWGGRESRKFFQEARVFHTH